MLQYFRKSVMRWLVAFFMVGALISIAMVAGLAFYYSKKSLSQAAFNQLKVINEIRKNQVITNLSKRMINLKMLSESCQITKIFSVLQIYRDTSDSDTEDRFDVSTEAYNSVYRKIDPYFRKSLEEYKYENIYLICTAHGHVMYAAEQAEDLGTSLKTGPYKNSELAKVLAKIGQKKKAIITDFEEQNRFTYIAVPVSDQKGKIYAIIAARIGPEEIIQSMKNRKGIGETYIVGEDFMIRAHAGMSRNMEPDDLIKAEMDTPGIRKSFKRGTGAEILKNRQGVRMLSAYTYVNLKNELGADFEWAIVSEIAASKAFSQIRMLGLQLIIMGGGLVVLSSMAGYIIGKSIATPLRKLCDKVTLMADGDLTVSIEPGRRIDEIGTLIDAFYYMLGTLRSQTKEITDGTQTIASSITQISTTATELATSSAETASSVSQITTTVEQVRQTAYMANEKSEQVAKGADHAAQIYDAGKKATQDSVAGMNRIKEDMSYIAESIVRLSEQTQSIGEIINAVNDLADQSNLLSVNASIEAAKAGEHGKGFAVVAQEVKSLADQSKDATNQVRTILNDIQKATSTAVMATERGTKAVEAGVRLSEQSGDSIDRLSHSVMESTQAAIRIAASSQEQLVGMDQLVHAMESIKEASKQNVEGAKQLEFATKNLKELGQNLKQLALMFKF